jgi:hypothetical protein
VEAKRVISNVNTKMPFKDPEIKREHMRKWRKTEKGKAYRAADKQSISGQWRAYRYGAKKRDLEWQLSKEEFSWLAESRCYFCGEEPQSGIDRLDSYKGYTIDNVVACCTRCNFMKSTMDEKFFIERCKKIVDHCLTPLASE